MWLYYGFWQNFEGILSWIVCGLGERGHELPRFGPLLETNWHTFATLKIADKLKIARQQAYGYKLFTEGKSAYDFVHMMKQYATWRFDVFQDQFET